MMATLAAEAATRSPLLTLAPRPRAAPHLAYRPDIDGLRAIAILYVVGFHAFPEFILGGFVGVDVFFVISGFLITNVILRSIDDGSFGYRDFYTRRVLRILPALLALLVPCVLFGWYILLTDEFERLLEHVAGAAGFVSNFVVWREAGYFDASAASKPLLHLWSLAIEEQFYLVWPLILSAATRAKRGLVVSLPLLTLVSFAINVWLAHSYPTVAFYSPVSRFWELAVGGGLAYLLEAHHPAPKLTHLLSAAGLSLLVAGCVLLDTSRSFPGVWALLPTIGAALVISATPDAYLNRVLLGNKVLVWVGLISYPLYLWHWPLLVFARLLASRTLFVRERLALVVIAILLAYLTYRFIETPVRSLRRHPARSSAQVARNLLFALGTVLATALVGLVVAFPPRQASPSTALLLAAKADWDYPSGLRHRVAAGSLFRAYEIDGELQTKTLFFGDSNMEQYFPRVAKLLADRPHDYNSSVFIGSQRERCFPIYRAVLTDEGDCGAIRRDVQVVARDPNVVAVTLAFSGDAYQRILEEGGQEAFVRMVSEFAALGKRVYVILNMPDGDELDPGSMFEGSRLSVLRPKGASDVHFDYARFLGSYGRDRAEVALLTARGGGSVIDPLETLCPRSTCPVFDDEGRPLYKDGHHMTASYARAKATYVDETLQPPAIRH
jgi:peptidoglycan/LPS O-acetylase OafA/YrhL